MTDRASHLFPALTQFERVRASDGQWDYQLPDTVGTVHIYASWRGWPTSIPRNEPRYGTPPDYFASLCGQTVKVILPTPADLGDEDVCQTCVGQALRRGVASDSLLMPSIINHRLGDRAAVGRPSGCTMHGIRRRHVVQALKRRWVVFSPFGGQRRTPVLCLLVAPQYSLPPTL
jgi:hypothetical protein